jgi:hypothetical protein
MRSIQLTRRALGILRVDPNSAHQSDEVVPLETASLRRKGTESWISRAAASPGTFKSPPLTSNFFLIVKDAQTIVSRDLVVAAVMYNTAQSQGSRQARRTSIHRRNPSYGEDLSSTGVRPGLGQHSPIISDGEERALKRQRYHGPANEANLTSLNTSLSSGQHHTAVNDTWSPSNIPTNTVYAFGGVVAGNQYQSPGPYPQWNSSLSEFPVESQRQGDDNAIVTSSQINALDQLTPMPLGYGYLSPRLQRFSSSPTVPDGHFNFPERGVILSENGSSSMVAYNGSSYGSNGSLILDCRSLNWAFKTDIIVK